MAQAQVNVVAHRGASGTRPENTAAAFAEAIRLRTEMIEFDVHLTADARLLVIHDPTVDRTSDGSGEVGSMTLAQLKQLDAGSWFAPEYTGERFLTLDETLDMMPPGMRLNVHVKANASVRERLLPMVIEILTQRQLLDTAYIASDEESLCLARRVQPELVVCNLSTKPAEDYVKRSVAVGCTIIQPGHAMTTPELVAEAHAQGLEVNPFYADTQAEMQRLIGCGVDGILTNQPERLQALLRRG